MLVWRFPEPLLVVSSGSARRWHRTARLGRQRPGARTTTPASTRDAPGRARSRRRAHGARGGDAHRGRPPRDVQRRRRGGAGRRVGRRHASRRGRPPPTSRSTGATPVPGTINIVAIVPERLSRAAMVNAVVTVTEAKAQALWDAGRPGHRHGLGRRLRRVSRRGTGANPSVDPARQWGARLARAVYRAVAAGCRRGAGRDHPRARRRPLGQVRRGRAARRRPAVTGDLRRHPRGGRRRRLAARRGAPPGPPSSDRGAPCRPVPSSPRCSWRVAGSVLVDSLGPWVGAAPGMDVDVDGAVLGAATERDGDTVVVSEEVGLSVHPVHRGGTPVP